MGNYRKHTDVSIAYGIILPIQNYNLLNQVVIFCVEWRTDVLLANTCSLCPNNM